MTIPNYPILSLFIKITIIELLVIVLLEFWVPPDSGAELGFLIVLMAICCFDGVVAIVFFFMHKDIWWKAWLILAFVSPLYYCLIDKIWIVIKH